MYISPGTTVPGERNIQSARTVVLQHGGIDVVSRLPGSLIPWHLSPLTQIHEESLLHYRGTILSSFIMITERIVDDMFRRGAPVVVQQFTTPADGYFFFLLFFINSFHLSRRRLNNARFIQFVTRKDVYRLVG